MKKINRFIGLTAISFTSIITGCKKFLEIPPPEAQLVTASVFSNDATATAAILSEYVDMYGFPQQISHKTGLLADEFINYNSGDQYIYGNALTPGSDIGPWTDGGGFYNRIYRVNTIIENLSSPNGVTAVAKNQLVGEAKFLRAFYHFYLTNCYGAVPLVLSTDYKQNRVIARTQRNEVYVQVIKDLIEAKDLLSDKFVDATDTVETTERVRPTKAASTALLARVYLYNGEWEKAEAAATEVLSNPKFILEQDLNNCFSTTSMEAIWQLQTPMPASSSDFPTAEALFYISRLGSEPGGGGASVSLSNWLLSSFEPGDFRRRKWVIDTVVSGTTYSYPFKYKGASSLVTYYSTVLRLAEQYLIRAEARANQGKFSDAISDLDLIRSRAGLPEYSGPLDDKDSILTSIYHERQVEFFTEWGHRWFDLIRTGKANEVMSVITPLKNGTWNNDGHQQLMPVPLSEIQKDPNLIQNSGY